MADRLRRRSVLAAYAAESRPSPERSSASPPVRARLAVRAESPAEPRTLLRADRLRPMSFGLCLPPAPGHGPREAA